LGKCLIGWTAPVVKLTGLASPIIQRAGHWQVSYLGIYRTDLVEAHLVRHLHYRYLILIRHFIVQSIQECAGLQLVYGDLCAFI
jgi:hypothetical protein